VEEKEKLVAGPRWWADTRTDWPTDRRSSNSFDFDCEEFCKRQLVGLCEMVASLRGCKTGSSLLLEAVTKQRSEIRDWEHSYEYPSGCEL
jgi:hypothetical protein